MNKHKYRFIDFNGLDALRQNNALTGQLIRKYQQIFNDPSLWGEQYTSSDVMHNLHKQLSGDAAIRLCLNREQNHQPVAFCWAQVLTPEEIVSNIENVQYYQALGAPQVTEVIRRVMGQGKAIYLHDLGVSGDCRGEVSLRQLILPTITRLADRTGVNQLLYWSIHDTRIHRLAERAGHERIAEVDGMQFFSGDLHALVADSHANHARQPRAGLRALCQSALHAHGVHGWGG
jgi:hypothetical protein